VVKHGVTEFLRAFEDVGTTFFDIETDLLIVLDEQGNIARVNPALEKSLNRRESEMLGHGMMQLICIDDWATFLRSFTSPNQPPIRLLVKDAGEIVVRMIAFRFKNQRGFLAFRPVRPAQGAT
jgi:PAS domain-containing protein